MMISANGTKTVWPEMDKSTLGQTLAVIGFHRKYVKQVFTSDELDQYLMYKREARRIRKQLKQKQFLDPKFNAALEEKNVRIDPLKHLELYRASKEGLEEMKPFGIDRKEAIKVMSHYGEKDLEKSRQTKQQLFRMIEGQITLNMAEQKRARAK